MTTSKSSPGAMIWYGARISPEAWVQQQAEIGAFARIEGRSFIGRGTKVGKESRIQNAHVGEGVEIGSHALIMAGARVCPNNVESGSSNARTLKDGVSIGPDVLLHDEVELGNHAVVPTQATIAHIGSFGSKQRVVTIYGTDRGPRYSVGCQIGVKLGIIRDNVTNARYTSRESAAAYVPYLEVFSEIGKAVQTAYDSENVRIQDIRDMRAELGMGVAEF